MRKFIFLAIISLACLHALCQDYKNPGLPVEKRVADLLKRMTLEEKVAQLYTVIDGRPKFDSLFFSDTSKVNKLLGLGIGMVNPNFNAKMDEVIENRNLIQHYLLYHTRLGIPTIFIDEGHHGLVRRFANVYPQGIGIACSWDTSLVAKIYNLIAAEGNAWGTGLYLAPVVDVCREPRWGRVGETFGEDPFLCGVFGSVIVKSFQGSANGIIAKGHIAATLKHLVGHGQPEGGNNQAPANYSERVIREFHLESFRICVRDAKPACIMASYNEVDGVPSHGNKWLLTNVLQNEWGYKGIVVSDWYGIDQLWKKHKIAENEKDAAYTAFNAGVTIDLPNGANYRHLTELVKEGRISIAAIDSAVVKILKLKFQLGLFEFKPIEKKKILEFKNNKEAIALSLKVAEESTVLLKNENNLLPIKKGQYKKIAVIGPCAAVNYLGDYSGHPYNNVSILKGLIDKVGKTAEIKYAEGCKITMNTDTMSMENYQNTDTLIFPPVDLNRKFIQDAVTMAKDCDFIIIAIGENEQLCREAWMNSHFGDNTSLLLQSQQEELVKEIAKLGKPFIVYLMHAKPFALKNIVDITPVIIDGHYSGQQTGNAFANILFGDVNPSGKLTMTYPENEGQIPLYYNHKPSAQYFDYLSGKPKPVFCFGYGLSYTTYNYSDLKISKTQMKDTEKVEVSINIKNTGKMDGDEIVQLYIRDQVSSVTRPVKELKGFKRISLKAGETKKVVFTIDNDMLAFWNIDMKRVSEAGKFDIMIGPDSNNLQKTELELMK